MTEITPKQKEFISNLVDNFDITIVSKEDASEVIECLSKFQNSYAPCGRHINVDISDAFVMGTHFWCMRHCGASSECGWYKEDTDEHTAPY